MLFSQAIQEMRKFNSRNGVQRKVDIKHLENGTLKEMVARVVLKNEKLVRPFTLEERTYTFSNYNKALTSQDLGYSIFAFCEYDNDCMRIENFNNDDFESVEIIEIVE